MNTENASRFRRGSSNIGLSPSAFWLRFTLENASQSPQLWWFDSGNRTLQEIDLYWPDENDTYQRTATGSKYRFAERPLSASTFVFPLVVQGGRQVDIYLRVRSTGFLGVALIPKLWQPDAFRLESRTALVLWFFALGIGAALALINLMLALYNRDINKLFYVLSLASGAWGLSSAAGGYGAAYEYFWPESPVFEQTAWVATISAVTIFPTLFMSYLLEFHRDRPQLTRVIYATAGFNVIATCFQVVVTAMQLPNAGAILQKAWAIGSLSYSLMDSALIYGVLTAAFSGNRSAKFIAVAFVPFLLLQTRAAYQTVYATLEWLPLILSIVYEWCVMALAVADRYYQTGLERSQAKAALVEGLKQSAYELEGKVIQRTEELQREQLRTKDLLHNILPAELADELSATGHASSARHESVSTLFTDFSGFTQAASTMPADRMVAELNEIFAGFDDICDELGVEKIKTIGDAYMAAAGLPKPCADHAQRCVTAGLRMIDAVEQRNLNAAFKWGLRVGIHSGPVVAGVVGKRKYAFDIWGDTVNIASRMESSGEVGRVNISAYTYDLVRNDYDCEYRGKVGAKGKGEIDMYFVKGIQAERPL